MTRQRVSHQVLRIPQVTGIVGVSTSTIWRWVSEGIFPEPVRIGPNSVGWEASTVNDWVELRAQARYTPRAPVKQNK